MDRVRCATSGSVLGIISKARSDTNRTYARTNTKYLFKILVFKSHRDRRSIGFSTDTLTDERMKERERI